MSAATASAGGAAPRAFADATRRPTVKLRDGSTPNDPRLGRIASFDERSKAFPARGLLAPEARIVSRTWRLDPRLDQLQTPRCTGFAWTHDHAAEPQRHNVTAALADRWYHAAQDNDEWAGSDYEGSSTLGAAKAGVQLGFFREYRWCFGVNDLLLALSNLGPVLLGTNWHRAMFTPDARGLIKVSGPVDGGHEWCARGVDLKREEIVARNSWGREWGYFGDFRLSFADLGRLLEDGGDAAHPVR
jgi:hypothetical protein